MPDHSPLRPSNPAPWRLLVVVSNRNFCATLQRILGRCGYAVDCANTGEEALCLLSATTYDAVVSDVHLPGQTCGISLMLHLRDAGLNVPVFLLTEEETARIRSALAACSGVTSVHLPLDLDHLKDMIARGCSCS